MIERRDDGGIRVLRFAHGKANALDLELLRALQGELEEARRAERAVVLTGGGAIFSAGVDLFRLVNDGEAYVTSFVAALSDALLDLFLYPRPVVVAVNGHAVAGGCILALAGDRRLMAEGRGRIGIPELLVGVPFPVVPLEICRAALAPNVLADLVVTGRTLEAAEAAACGVIDALVPPAELEERARAEATALAAVPAAAFARTKRALRQPALDRIAAARPTDDPATLALWRDPATHEAIRAYLQRTLGRSR